MNETIKPATAPCACASTGAPASTTSTSPTAAPAAAPQHNNGVAPALASTPKSSKKRGSRTH